jgi:hypothetical protein
VFAMLACVYAGVFEKEVAELKKQPHRLSPCGDAQYSCGLIRA